MAKYGPNSLTVNYDNSSGTPVDMTQYVLTINDVQVEAIMEESHSFGDSWFESLATGIRRVNPVEMSGFYDDTATTGPDAIWNAVASGPSVTLRTLQVVWGASKSISVETLIAMYGRQATRNVLTKYSVRLQPSGAATEA